jgi:hypothetical protein
MIYFWEISADANSIFDRWGNIMVLRNKRGMTIYDENDNATHLPRNFLNREKAEAFMLPHAEKAHKFFLDAAIDTATTYEDEYDQEAVEFWKTNPPLNVHRTDTQTIYLCGEPDWDSRDRRGRVYGWLIRQEIVE